MMHARMAVAVVVARMPKRRRRQGVLVCSTLRQHCDTHRGDDRSSGCLSLTWSLSVLPSEAAADHRGHYLRPRRSEDLAPFHTCCRPASYGSRPSAQCQADAQAPSHSLYKASRSSPPAAFGHAASARRHTPPLAAFLCPVVERGQLPGLLGQ
jgi:hypothetical protein